ncbi:hypothetical protein CMUS01_01498 [Colletotrichum musicola]|uniref:Uncharacterized protein n=1 Tax=Colletotrichum musicola TaxID=2175873 RepID=A0A8H6NX11_9PEZI|nr:hypothetical protein CMUS01_01498 [Colletotrichum musicola]
MHEISRMPLSRQGGEWPTPWSSINQLPRRRPSSRVRDASATADGHVAVSTLNPPRPSLDSAALRLRCRGVVPGGSFEGRARITPPPALTPNALIEPQQLALHLAMDNRAGQSTLLSARSHAIANDPTPSLGFVSTAGAAYSVDCGALIISGDRAIDDEMERSEAELPPLFCRTYAAETHTPRPS